MKKGLKITKQELQELYLKQNLSLSQIANKFGCEGTNILYWLKKFDIKRRPAYRKKIHIDKNVLEDYYWNKRLTPREIAKIFGIKNERTVRKKLEKYGIKRKTISDALTKKFKADFSKDLAEKSFFLGLRAGDFHAKKMKKSVRVQTTTTHLAQIGLLDNSLGKYGEIRKYYSTNSKRNDEWFIYIDLNESFDFLIEKPKNIPDWIINNEKLFFLFLTAYSDCESDWHFSKNHKKHFRYTFRLRTGDKIILEQIKRKLDNFGLNILLDNIGKTIVREYKSDIEIYSLIINNKEDNLFLIEKMLSLSKHSEKIRKMKLILDNKHKSWKEVEPLLENLRKEIKKETLLMKSHN